jgi:hypothetical protein
LGLLRGRPRHGDACAVERAADALHCRWIDAEPRSAMTRMPGRPGVARASRIRPTKPLPLAPGPRKSGADAFLNHGALELGKYAHHLKHRLAGRRRGVEPPLQQLFPVPMFPYPAMIKGVLGVGIVPSNFTGATALTATGRASEITAMSFAVDAASKAWTNVLVIPNTVRSWSEKR